MMYILLGVIFMCSAAVFGASKTDNFKKKEASFTLSSPGFKDGQPLNSLYSLDGGNESPSLSWAGAPEGTKSFALIVDDPDAPGKVWVHWVVFNIPATTTEFSESLGTKKSLPNGTKQGKNDFGKIGYGGPQPPQGKAHRYLFKLYALDTVLIEPAGATKQDIEAAMKGHILASTQIMGTYATKEEAKKKK